MRLNAVCEESPTIGSRWQSIKPGIESGTESRMESGIQNRINETYD